MNRRPSQSASRQGRRALKASFNILALDVPPDWQVDTGRTSVGADARLLRVQCGRSSEKMDVAQLRLMFEEIDVPEAADDDVPAASKAKPTRKAGTRAPIPAHIPRQTTRHLPEPCGGGGNEAVICEDVTEVLDYP